MKNDFFSYLWAQCALDDRASCNQEISASGYGEKGVVHVLFFGHSNKFFKGNFSQNLEMKKSWT